MLTVEGIEILIESQSHSYYQIAFSATGVLYDADWQGGGGDGRDSAAEVKDRVGEGYWTAGIRMPNDRPGHGKEACVAGRLPQRAATR